MKIQSEKDLTQIAQDYQQKLYRPKKIKVNIGMASCGIAAGAQDGLNTARQALEGDDTVEICQTGCIGFCRGRAAGGDRGRRSAPGDVSENHPRPYPRCHRGLPLRQV